MSVFQPPPTYAEVVLVDPAGKNPPRFNPIWLNWFLGLVQNLSAGGGGSVSSVSVVGANGISGSVANATTTPAITLALGAITPSSVVASGTVSGTNITIGGNTTGNAATATLAATATTVSAPWTTWTPTRTSWIDVGAPTVTARYCQVGKIVFFQIKIVPATTTATTAGTSYVSLPVAAGGSALSGMAQMMNITTLISVGDAVMDVVNSRCYVPTQGATGNTLTIFGEYEVA